MCHTILLVHLSGFLRYGRWDKRGVQPVAFFAEGAPPQKNATGAARRLSYPAEKARMHSTPGSPQVERKSEADCDLEDVARVLAGDVEAFGAIVLRWQGPIVNMAWRYCRDRGRAEELAQEAFVRAWRGLASWRRESSFSTWLFALAANVFRNELKRVPAITVPIEDAPEPSRPAPQHNQAAEREQHEVLRRAVLALPHLYREPVVLFYFHEMDVSAAARTMQVPEGTFKARLARGRELLRKRFPQLRELSTTPFLRAGDEVSS
jgi:RNA polymerase sigma-70 factor, ECF subfamily